MNLINFKTLVTVLLSGICLSASSFANDCSPTLLDSSSQISGDFFSKDFPEDFYSADLFSEKTIDNVRIMKDINGKLTFYRIGNIDRGTVTFNRKTGVFKLKSRGKIIETIQIHDLVKQANGQFSFNAFVCDGNHSRCNETNGYKYDATVEGEAYANASRGKVTPTDFPKDYSSVDLHSEKTIDNIHIMKDVDGKISYYRIGGINRGRATFDAQLKLFKIYQGRSIIETIQIHDFVKESNGQYKFTAYVCDGNKTSCDEKTGYKYLANVE